MAVKLMSKQIITDVDFKGLVKNLYTAFADEWLAYYQYWLGAQIATGIMRDTVVAELMEHANEELKHAQMITNRLIQLGVKIQIQSNELNEISSCKYNAVKSEKVKIILQENIKGEQCAIKFYDGLLKELHCKDFVTSNMVSKILDDEVKHEQDLVSILEDLGI